METISKIVNNSLFRAGLCGAIATALFINGSVLYAGIAIGVGVREFLLAFKSA
tara:strand:- start:2189 stop:2347 length:159 start_codon:yes stop_codon:yes gene_type:complete